MNQQKPRRNAGFSPEARLLHCLPQRTIRYDRVACGDDERRPEKIASDTRKWLSGRTVLVYRSCGE
jgi:hypothetical protein